MKWIIFALCVPFTVSINITTSPTVQVNATSSGVGATTLVSTLPSPYQILTVSLNETINANNAIKLPCPAAGIEGRAGVLQLTRADIYRGNLSISSNCSWRSQLYVNIRTQNLNAVASELIYLRSQRRAYPYSWPFDDASVMMSEVLGNNRRVNALLHFMYNSDVQLKLTPVVRNNTKFTETQMNQIVVSVEYMSVTRIPTQSAGNSYAYALMAGNKTDELYCRSLNAFIPSALCPLPFTNNTLNITACPRDNYDAGNAYTSGTCLLPGAARLFFNNYQRPTTTTRWPFNPYTQSWWYTTRYYSNANSINSDYYYYRNVGLGVGITCFAIGVFCGILKACLRSSSSRQRHAAHVAAVSTVIVNNGTPASENRVIMSTVTSQQPFFGAPPSYEDVTKTALPTST